MSILITALQLAKSVSAQPIWRQQDNGNFIAVEMYKPKFSERDGFSFFSAAFFLSGGFHLKRNLILVANLPVAHAAIKVESFEASETIIGNPYIGLEFRKPGSSHFVEIGAWLPRLPESDFPVSAIAESADYDRLEAFIYAAALTGKFNYSKKNKSNLVLWLGGGQTIFFGGDVESAQMSLDYAIHAGYEGPQAKIIGDVSGRFLVTGQRDFGERHVHNLGASFSYLFGSVRPGIHLHIVINQNSDWVSSGNDLDYVFGLNLLAQLN